MGSIQPPHDCSGNLDKKEKLYGSVQGVITCAEAEVGEHSPPQQTKHIFLLQDPGEEGPGTSQVQPEPSLQSDTFLCWFIWQFKCDLGLEAQQLLKDLWCWDFPAGEGWVPMGVSDLCTPALRSCSTLPFLWLKEMKPHRGDIQGRSRHHLLPEAARIAWSHGLLIR